jgi:hypothetical protein
MATCKFHWDYAELRRLYESGMSPKAIGSMLGRDHRLVRYHLQRTGITLRSTGESRELSGDVAFSKVHDQIAADHQAGMTVRQLQDKHPGVYKRVADLCAALPARELAVQRRRPTLTPELRAAYSASAKAQWQRMTSEQREALRSASIGAKRGEKNVNYGKVWSTQGRGKRTPGVGCSGQAIVFRSTWEKAFADHLNAQGVAWQYEPEAIKCGDLGTYTPDFYVESWDCFVEVKGWLSPKAKEKIEWVRANDTRPLVLATKQVLRQQYGVRVN